jgi:2-oxoglutarate dehydrogenase E1 component
MSHTPDNTYLFSANIAFIEELYLQYKTDPNSVSKDWVEFFKNYSGDDKTLLFKNGREQIIGVVDATANIANKDKKGQSVVQDNTVADLYKLSMLVEAYRKSGHLATKLDPLGLEDVKTEQELGLTIENFGFSSADYQRTIDTQGMIGGLGKATLSQVVAKLKAAYSRFIGVEYSHINSVEEHKWIQHKMESLSESGFGKEEKLAILKGLAQAELFESFLHKKFPGTKRFSVEGGASSIVAIENIINQASSLGVDKVVIGMPHRGRLGMLTQVAGKPYYAMFSEFQGHSAFPESLGMAGDVKYHMGSSVRKTLSNQKEIDISLMPNPSHLEAVNTVVAGKVRAEQYLRNDAGRDKVMGILLHGDASFAGQGVVAESLTLSELNGYTTGGIIHVIINNQVGFTTNPRNARAGRYSTDMAKIIQAPIFHVNGDCPEEVVKVAKLAAEFRQTFKKDVIIEVVCYRLHGHNETDEPMFTQPTMYKLINEHPTTSDLYAKHLMNNNEIAQDQYENIKTEITNFFEKELEIAKTYKPNKADWLEGNWSAIKQSTLEMIAIQTKTGVKLDKLKKLGVALATYPKDFHVNSKIARQLEAKRKMMETGEGLDWAMGEGLAFASLLAEGKHIRLTGQDCGRGTFSHRHAVLIDQENESRYVMLNNLADNQGYFEVHNSNLSEFAVLGFEYGYSMASPNNLVLWEAQFGDFANGAQVIIDQFISSSESKWLRMSGLVMLLPHGYEGQGPEHSSARLERYLQLCAEDNMQVVNCTTPASFFHALRRQIHSHYRKPLIVMTPKSLLRHRLAISSLNEFGEDTTFKPVISEVDSAISAGKIRKVVFCSGKVYYDLLEARTAANIKDVALVRLEQYYPFPAKEVKAELEQYKNAEVVWCQEEPRNMGAWQFVAERFAELRGNQYPKYVGRKAAASPAVGYKKVHDKEQEQLVKEAL